MLKSVDVHLAEYDNQYPEPQRLPTLSKHSESMFEKGYPDSTAPPYYLYDMIKEQPVAVDASVKSAREQAIRLRELLHSIGRIFTTGCGTSYHWAVVAQHMVRQSFGSGIGAEGG